MRLIIKGYADQWRGKQAKEARVYWLPVGHGAVRVPSAPVEGGVLPLRLYEV